MTTALGNGGWYWEDREGVRAVGFCDGYLGVYFSEQEGFDIALTYASSLNLASKLLQWATNLPESEKGDIHKINGEWVDVDGK